MRKFAARWVLAGLLLSTGTVQCRAYSVFTHEQLIDLTWNRSIQPLLKQRFPGATASDLRRAHAYAYGGCAIQDLGYYPFGNTFFSDLTHYVRTGDFIEILLRDAQTVEEYAFALGALSHYVGDTIGHEDAVNPSTSIDFPKLAAKFGPAMTYDENPHAHVRTEFGFDVDQLSKARLAPSAYLRFIGLRVSRGLLERAYFQTYCLHLKDVLGSRRPTFQTYAWAVRSFLPRIAYAETVNHRGKFQGDASGEALQTYKQHLADADFQTLWNSYRRKPSFETYLVALLLRVVPKVGPLADAAICLPSNQTDQLYVESLNRAVAQFANLISRLKDGQTDIVDNLDLDTGRKIRPGEYPLTDETFAKLLDVLAKHKDRKMPPELRAEVLAYYNDPSTLEHWRTTDKRRKRVAERIANVRGKL